MKVLHLIGGGDVGGAKTHVLSLLSGLGAHITAELVSFRAGGFADEAIALGIPTHIIATGSILRDIARLRELYRAGDFDIVHCHGAKGNMMGSILKYREGASVVTTVHSDPRLDYLGRPLGALTYGNINKVALRLIPDHIGVSDPVSDMLIRRGFSPYGIFTIYNGLDFTPDESPFDRAAYLRSLGVDYAEGDVICCIAARLDPVKDIGTLIRAFARTPARMKLVIAGGGAEEASLKAQAAASGAGDRIFFAGWLDSADPLYRASDINLLTSLSETFPYAVTEGARQKLATISSRVGGIPMLIDHGTNGFLFTPGDADTLAELLNRLGDDPELRRTFGERIYEKASREFSIDATIARQLSIYETILARKNLPPKSDITICGAYGKGNTGDDAILQAVIEELREAEPLRRLHVLSRKPKELRLRHRADSFYTFDLFALRKALRGSALYINGGGSLIQDVTSTRSLLFYLFTLRFAKRCGCRVQMYGCGIGPVNKPINRRRAGRIIDRCADEITLREDGSLEELRRLGVTKPAITLAADPALALRPAPAAQVDAVLRENGLDPSDKYLCFTVRPWSGIGDKLSAFTDAARHVHEKYGMTPVFLPIEPVRDLELSRKLAAEAGCGVIATPLTPALALGVLSRMQAAVSMRLHGLVFAAAAGLPLVGVSYDQKVTSFLRYMDQDLCIDLEDLTGDRLCALIDRAMEKDPEVLRRSVARLRQMESRNTEAALRLLHQ